MRASFPGKYKMQMKEARARMSGHAPLIEEK
jgi:hypothetical protein